VLEERSLDEIVRTPGELREILERLGGGPHYVYVLRQPDNSGGLGTPFYVGIGQGNRIFSHEEEARDPSRSSAKIDAIRAIWATGREVVRTIDSVHTREPWDREEELINSIGRLSEGTGPLTNAQVYTRSQKVDGVELRKYATDYAATGDVNAIPPWYRLRNVRLMAGPRPPRSRKSVPGKIYAVIEKNPGVTGEELITLLQAIDFSENKSPYTQDGAVCASWLAGYIEGGYFKKARRDIQAFTDVAAPK
jgi:hypothetical protein